jgi:hypothetical protein
MCSKAWQMILAASGKCHSKNEFENFVSSPQPLAHAIGQGEVKATETYATAIFSAACIKSGSGRKTNSG